MRLWVQLGQAVPRDWCLALAWPSCTKSLMPVSQPSCYKRGLLCSGHNLEQQPAEAGHTQPCPAPATWSHACLREVPAHRLALTGTSMLPEFMALYTLYAYSSTRGAGWLCWGRNASPTPQKKPSVFSPVPSPDGHPSPWPTMVKQAAFREENHKEPFHMIFCFTRIWAWGFPKHTHEDLWIDLLTKYIIMAKLKCNWFKFFDARSEKQEVAEKIFSSKEINKHQS